MTVAHVALILNAPPGPLADRPDRPADSKDGEDFAAMMCDPMPDPFLATLVAPQPTSPVVTPDNAEHGSTKSIETVTVTRLSTGAVNSPGSIHDNILSDTAFELLIGGTNPVTGPTRSVTDTDTPAMNVAENAKRTGQGFDGAVPGSPEPSQAQVAATTAVAASRVLAVISLADPTPVQRAMADGIVSPDDPSVRSAAPVMLARVEMTARFDANVQTGMTVGTDKLTARTGPVPPDLRQTPGQAALPPIATGGPGDRHTIPWPAMAPGTITRPESTNSVVPANAMHQPAHMTSPVTALPVPAPLTGQPTQMTNPVNTVPVPAPQTGQPAPMTSLLNTLTVPAPPSRQPARPAKDANFDSGRHVGPFVQSHHIPTKGGSIVPSQRDNPVAASILPGLAPHKTGQPILSDGPLAAAIPFVPMIPSGDPWPVPHDQPGTEARLARHVAGQITTELGWSQGKPTEIVLDPEELGRVRLSLVTGDTSITVVIQTERPETGELMRRHIDQLAQEFRGLGYQSVSFSFGPETGSQEKDGQSQNRSTQTGDFSEDRPLAPQSSPAKDIGPGQLDLRL